MKNDTQRTGFQVFLPTHENVLLDPVVILQDYIARTEDVHTDNAVFLALKRPPRLSWPHHYQRFRSGYPCPKGVQEDSWREILSVYRTSRLELSFFLC